MKSLPDDLLTYILSWLVTDDVLSLRSVSSSLNQRMTRTKYIIVGNVSLDRVALRCLWRLKLKCRYWKGPSIDIKVHPEIVPRCLALMPFEECVLTVTNIHAEDVIRYGAVKHIFREKGQEGRLRKLRINAVQDQGLQLPPLRRLEHLDISGRTRISSTIDAKRYPCLKNLRINSRVDDLACLSSTCKLIRLTIYDKHITERQQEILFQLAKTLKHVVLVARNRVDMGSAAMWPQLETLEINALITPPLGVNLEQITLMEEVKTHDYNSAYIRDCIMRTNPQCIELPTLFRKRELENSCDISWLSWIESIQDRKLTFSCGNFDLAIVTLKAFPTMQVYVSDSRLTIDLKEGILKCDDVQDWLSVNHIRMVQFFGLSCEYT